MLAISEAGVYGLAPEVLAESEAAIPADERDSVHAVVLQAARAYADRQTGSAPLAAAAVALRTKPIGARRALMQIVADWFEAEALRRDGDTAGAKRVARRGLDAATALNHVWLVSGFERALAR